VAIPKLSKLKNKNNVYICRGAPSDLGASVYSTSLGTGGKLRVLGGEIALKQAKI
jgi:hypothetical protein